MADQTPLLTGPKIQPAVQQSSDKKVEIVDLDSTEKKGLLDIIEEPKQEIQDLQELCSKLWDNHEDLDVVRRISERLRYVEAQVCRKYETYPKERKKQMDIGDLKETLDAMNELTGSVSWIFRFPSLVITVIIASACIPLAQLLDHVIIAHPVLGGFPPAISAAAGCIGIQNTAIIIRALGVKLIKTNRLFIFIRYLFISGALSFGAAVIEMIVAWIVVSVSEGSERDPFTWQLLFTDVPVVIFFAMLVTGFMAGLIGAGVPLLVWWISMKSGKHLDPAHWVGPIETVVQELCATMLTFWIADSFVFPKV